VVVLFSLILAVGMLVDGAIVVVELAERYREEGRPRQEAFLAAAQRMSWPLIASVATTLAVFIPLLAAYLLLPWLLLSGPQQADNHYVKTLSHPVRAGRYVEFDRNDYSPAGNGTGRLRTFAGEELTLKGNLPDEPATLSLQGRFLTETTIEVQDYHVHSRTFRDGASYLGLLLIPLLWGMSIFRQRRQQLDQSCATGP
jgi:hypothetical protein